MNHSIKIIFGQEQINKFLAEIPFTDEEKIINEKEYHFETEIELKAFIKGVNESVGWLDFYIVNSEDKVRLMK